MKKNVLIVALILGICAGFLGTICSFLQIASVPNVQDIYVVENLRTKEGSGHFVVLIIANTCSSCRRALYEWEKLSVDFDIPIYVLNVDVLGGRDVAEYIGNASGVSVTTTPAVFVYSESTYHQVPLRTNLWRDEMENITRGVSASLVFILSVSLMMTCGIVLFFPFFVSKLNPAKIK